jgi:hypothetical protein
MLGSMGIKDEIMLYCIGYGGYGITLNCNAISGVTGYYRPRCWLTNVGWVVKLGNDQICGTGTPTCVDGVLIAIGGREVMNSSPINCFNLLSTQGQFLNSCPINNMHKLLQFQ